MSSGCKKTCNFWVLDGIKQNVESQGLAIPHFNRVPPENAEPQDVQQVLNELRILQQNNY